MKQYTSSIRGKLFKYFEGRLRIKKSTNNWWRCDCPYCGKFHTMGIHLENYRVHCFYCKIETNPVRLLMNVEEFETYSQAWKFLQIQQEYDAYDRMAVKPKEKELTPIELPESFRLLIHGENFMGRAARHYMTKRGFNIDKLSMAGIGYCTKGEYAGYIIFPYTRKGKLVYFQGRLYMGTGPKMKNPPEELYGIGKTQLIYNEDALFIYNKVYALESITNSLTLGDNTIGLSGKTVANYQLSRIIQSPCETIISILDPDAWKENLDLCLQLVHHKRVKAVRLPGEGDVNEIGKKKTLEFVKNTPYQKYIDLYRLKLNLNENPIVEQGRIRNNLPTSRGY